MPVYRLPEEVAFPPPTEAEPSGLLAVGGDLSPERLLTAYANGIFPWYSEDEPILWSLAGPPLRPPPVRAPGEPQPPQAGPARRLPRHPRHRLRGRHRALPGDAAAGPGGHVDHPEMRDAYIALHEPRASRTPSRPGGARSWSAGSTGSGWAACSPASMFAHAPDASKVAFVWLVRQLERWGVALIDCQIQTDHLDRFGAEDLDRDAFLDALPDLVRPPYGRGRWRFDPDLDPLQSAPPPDDAPAERQAPALQSRQTRSAWMVRSGTRGWRRGPGGSRPRGPLGVGPTDGVQVMPAAVGIPALQAVPPRDGRGEGDQPDLVVRLPHEAGEGGALVVPAALRGQRRGLDEHLQLAVRVHQVVLAGLELGEADEVAGVVRGVEPPGVVHSHPE